MPGEVAVVDADNPALANGGSLASWTGAYRSTPGTLNGIDTAAAQTDFSRKMTVWSVAGSISFVSVDANLVQTGSALGNSSRRFKFKVTASGCPSGGCEMVLGWSAHIATLSDWGAGKSAADINGAPYHMRLIGIDTVDGNGGGNADMQMSSSAIASTFGVTKLCRVDTGDTFNLNVNGVAYVNGVPSTAGLPCGGSTLSVEVDPNSTATIFESLNTGISLNDYNVTYDCGGSSGTLTTSATSSSSFQVTVGNTQSLVCTITNDLKRSYLTLIKNVDNSTWGGSAAASDFTLSATATSQPVLSGAGGFTSLEVMPRKSYSLSESSSLTSSYDGGAWNCTVGESTQSGSSISLNPGENGSCSITNTSKPALLTLVKTVVNAYGSTASSSDWTLTASGPSTASGTSGSVPVTAAQVKSGMYALSESGPSGFTASAWTCTGTGVIAVVTTESGASSVNLANGANATCTVTNTAQQPHLTIIKHMVNLSATTPWVASDFTLTVTASGPSQTAVVGSESGTTITLNVGSFNVTEGANAGPLGYVATYSGCSGSVAPGETKTCTVTNTEQPVTVGASPRTIGYWKNWNTCSGGSQATVAASKGGAANGYFMLDDYLSQIVVGTGAMNYPTCANAVKVLGKSDTITGKSMASDPAYALASQLIASEANVAMGAAHTPAVDAAIVQAKALLISISFTGSGKYNLSTTQKNLALSLATTLDIYNNTGH